MKWLEANGGLKLVNLANVTAIYIEEEWVTDATTDCCYYRLWADTVDGGSHLVATFSNEDSARQVLEGVKRGS